jgi:hypothetical protein
MFNFLKKKQIQKPVLPLERGVYAFMKYKRGEFILYIKQEGDVLNFMQLPDRYDIKLSIEEFTAGIQTKLLEFVECIPEDVFDVCKANINKLEHI